MVKLMAILKILRYLYVDEKEKETANRSIEFIAPNTLDVATEVR